MKVIRLSLDSFLFIIIIAAVVYVFWNKDELWKKTESQPAAGGVSTAVEQDIATGRAAENKVSANHTHITPAVVEASKSESLNNTKTTLPDIQRHQPAVSKSNSPQPPAAIETRQPADKAMASPRTEARQEAVNQQPATRSEKTVPQQAEPGASDASKAKFAKVAENAGTVNDKGSNSVVPPAEAAVLSVAGDSEDTRGKAESSALQSGEEAAELTKSDETVNAVGALEETFVGDEQSQSGPQKEPEAATAVPENDTAGFETPSPDAEKTEAGNDAPQAIDVARIEPDGSRASFPATGTGIAVEENPENVYNALAKKKSPSVVFFRQRMEAFKETLPVEQKQQMETANVEFDAIRSNNIDAGENGKPAIEPIPARLAVATRQESFVHQATLIEQMTARQHELQQSLTQMLLPVSEEIGQQPASLPSVQEPQVDKLLPMFLAARKSFTERDYLQAEQQYRTIAAAYPEFPDVMAELAKLYHVQGKKAEYIQANNELIARLIKNNRNQEAWQVIHAFKRIDKPAVEQAEKLPESKQLKADNLNKNVKIDQ